MIPDSRFQIADFRSRDHISRVFFVLVAVHTPNLLYSEFVLLYMNQQLPIPESLWNTIPADAQAALRDAWRSMEDRIAELEATVHDLQARLQLNSTNSSKPPSSDPIGLKRRPPTPPSRRKRGGQPGHRKAFRALVPPEKLRSSRDCKPSSCRRCGQTLCGEDPDPLIHQVADLPKIEPIVDEYRLHRLSCPGCGATTCATLPAGVPAGNFSPYTQAVLATLAGAYRLSKRQIQQLAGDLLGLSISTGMISKLERQSAVALEAPYNELAVAVRTAAVIHADETSWRQERGKAWLWVAVTALMTVFTIARRRNAEVARAVLGTHEGAIAVTDRWSSYDWIAAAGRQICWSHLRRDFQAMIDRGGAAEPIGKELLRLSDRLFRWWHRLEAEEADWEHFGAAMARLRREVKATLEDAGRCDCATTRGTCAEILRVEESLWTFARVAGVPPTNNAAERAQRHAVIWRRISGGTDSAEGSRFVERMLTVVATCRQQGRDVLDYLKSCFDAARSGQAIPSLLPATPPKLKVA
jgi:transposase